MKLEATNEIAYVDEGGDSACWAHLVCTQCGALESEGHHAACTSNGSLAVHHVEPAAAPASISCRTTYPVGLTTTR